MRRLTRWRLVPLVMLLALTACAAKSGNGSDDNRHGGFYGGVTGGWSP